MKIALLANGENIHTVRWANGLVERGCEIHVLSAHAFSPYLFPEVRAHSLRLPPPWSYLFSARQVRRQLAQIKPDILHVHYASGYGTLGRLSGFHPYLLSVWGADVYDFPRNSPLQRRLVTSNLRSADCVCSTSHTMAEQCYRLWPGLSGIQVIAFGVDSKRFCSADRHSRTPGITVGTVKTLSRKYGIDTLIRGFAKCRSALQHRDPTCAKRVRLRIVGDGPQRYELEQLARTVGVADVTSFVGAVPHDRVPSELNELDIYVAVSRLDSESFGVAVLEASACELPVVVSDAGGLPEVVENGKTGLVILRENPERLAEALNLLIARGEMRTEFGRRGRCLVQQRYEWQHCVDSMLEVYDRMLADSRQRRAA